MCAYISHVNYFFLKWTYFILRLCFQRAYRVFYTTFWHIFSGLYPRGSGPNSIYIICTHLLWYRVKACIVSVSCQNFSILIHFWIFHWYSARHKRCVEVFEQYIYSKGYNFNMVSSFTKRRIIIYKQWRFKMAFWKWKWL